MEQDSREKKENTKENQSVNKKVFDDAHCAFLCLKPGTMGLLFFSSTETGVRMIRFNENPIQSEASGY